MTDKERYEVILNLLIEKIKKQEDDLLFKDIQLEDLKKKLAEAEYHLNPSSANAKKLVIRKEVK